MQLPRARAFTIVEMLVVIAIIAALAGVLLPAISNARDQSRVAVSESNLRQLGIAHNNYASEWNDRQFTLTRDDIASYGLREGTPGARASAMAYRAARLVQGETQIDPPPIILGWSVDPNGSGRSLTAFTLNEDDPRNYVLLAPITFNPTGGGDDKPKFGYFRLPNARQFGQYLSGRFFDPIYFAPKDTVVVDMRDEVADDPSEFPDFDLLTSGDGYGWSATDFCFSSYSLSPAALFSPDVMRRIDPDAPDGGGWRDPWSLPAGLRAPSLSQASYTSLKTHMIEHHWLQGRRRLCNEAMEESERPYHDCQPYFFNQDERSAPATLFYDGHVALVGVNAAVLADARMEAQTGTDNAGLWSRDTPYGEDGYWSDIQYDTNQAGTSFHILTTDGIRGRDFTADGG